MLFQECRPCMLQTTAMTRNTWFLNSCCSRRLTGYSTLSAPSTSGILTTMKMLADHYPERLAKAFIVDASSMFYYIWKVRWLFRLGQRSCRLRCTYCSSLFHWLWRIESCIRSEIVHLEYRVSALLLTTRLDASWILHTPEIIGLYQGRSILQKCHFYHHRFQNILGGDHPAFVQMIRRPRFLSDPKQVHFRMPSRVLILL